MGRRPDEPLIALGAVARPHGVRGELRVHPYNPDSELLLGLDRIWLLRDGERRELEITGARPHKGLFLLTLAGVDDRDGAEALRGCEVAVPRGALPEPDEDEYYHADLVGLTAVGADGSPLGTVSTVIQYPSVDCLELRAEAGIREIPLLEAYVSEIDLEAGRVVVEHWEDFELRAPKRSK